MPEHINKMKKSEDINKEKFKYQLAGWILYIICAVFFIASSLKNYDIWALAGGITFLIANIVFLISLIRSNKNV